MPTNTPSSMINQNRTLLVSFAQAFVGISYINSKSIIYVVMLIGLLLPASAISEPATIQLITPAHEATIRNTQGQVHISWLTSPIPNVVYEIYLDNVLKKTTPHTAMALIDVERGAHTIYLLVRDKNGKVIAVSPTHTIFVHQNSKLFR